MRRLSLPRSRQGRAPLLLVTGLAAALAGCGGSTPVPGAAQPGWTVVSEPPVYQSKDWTFLVYMNAANDLDPDSAYNVNQMEQIGSNSNVNVVVQWKRYSSWNGATRRYYITRDTTALADSALDTTGIASPLLSTNANLDMGSAQTLQDFVQWGVKAFPAQHYCLVLWDHGAGWRAQTVAAGRGTTAKLLVTRGISYDELTGNHIDTTQLGPAITVGGTFKWDLLAMDASLMQMAEVDYEMRNQTLYIAGSEESPSELGYPYNSLLYDLESNPAWNGKSLGVDFCKEMLSFYGTNSDVTQSVVESSQLAPLPGLVNTLGAALLAAQSSDGSLIGAARDATQTVDSPDYAGYYSDLYNFTTLLTVGGSGVSPVSNAAVQSAARAVQAQLANTILYSIHGNQCPHMEGLTIFLPTPSVYAQIASQQASSSGPGGGSLAYAALSFVQAAPEWNAWLQTGPSP